jgi:hypothetical protein
MSRIGVNGNVEDACCVLPVVAGTPESSFMLAMTPTTKKTATVMPTNRRPPAAFFPGAPQFGQALAFLLVELPHSLQAISPTHHLRASNQNDRLNHERSGNSAFCSQ